VIVLASASPRRAELLRAAGIEFEVIPAHIDETAHPHEAEDIYVRRIAAEKARAVAARVGDRIVLAADTTVVVDEMMLAKPEDDADAKRMLRMLSGRTHEVLTAVAISRGPDGPAPLRTEPLVEVERTGVEFAPLSEFEIDWYVATGEPRDKAGAYAIQGYASRFVTRIDGSYSNVVGLPVALVYELLKGLTTL
jgi:septum formation protein